MHSGFMHETSLENNHYYRFSYRNVFLYFKAVHHVGLLVVCGLQVASVTDRPSGNHYVIVPSLYIPQ